MPNNEIHSTAEMAEQEWDGHSEPSDVETDMVATREPEGRGIEFHVSMRDYTMQDMEALIIEAAARMLVGSHRDAQIKKQVEDRAMALISEKADQALLGVAAEIIDQPVTPSYGEKQPVTMRELLGLTGREYLTQVVDREGKPTKRDAWSTTYTRIELIVSRIIEKRFKDEIEKATNDAVREVQGIIRAEHMKVLEAEKARIRDALAKATA